MWFGKKKKTDPAEAARALREQALTISAADVNVTPGDGHATVWGVLMETGYEDAVVTLATFAEGTTSLYFSSGGGIIGAGEYQTVREAAYRLIALADSRVGEFAVVDDHPPPATARVRFYLRTFDGLRSAEAAEEDLGEGRHALSPVFYAAHDVITAIRETGAA